MSSVPLNTWGNRFKLNAEQTKVFILLSYFFSLRIVDVWQPPKQSCEVVTVFQFVGWKALAIC